MLQTILCAFDFKIECIKGETNSLFNLVNQGFLQGQKEEKLSPYKGLITLYANKKISLQHIKKSPQLTLLLVKRHSSSQGATTPFINSGTVIVIIIEHEDTSKNPPEISSMNLRGHSLPYEGRNKNVHKAILVDARSISIQHNWSNKERFIAYSKLHIMDVISCKDWGFN